MDSIKIPKEIDETINKLMVKLDIGNRPDVLRIALTKGIATEDHTFDETKYKDTSGREIPLKTLLPDNMKILVFQSIKQKALKDLSEEEVIKQVRTNLIKGALIMNDEVSKLDKMDNYLVSLFNQHSKETSYDDSERAIKEILDM